MRTMIINNKTNSNNNKRNNDSNTYIYMNNKYTIYIQNTINTHANACVQ